MAHPPKKIAELEEVRQPQKLLPQFKKFKNKYETLIVVCRGYKVYAVPYLKASSLTALYYAN